MRELGDSLSEVLNASCKLVASPWTDTACGTLEVTNYDPVLSMGERTSKANDKLAAEKEGQGSILSQTAGRLRTARAG